uniref:Mobilization protein mbeC n=1 Tax=Edwardsiella tarda TaxID=636 RepID=A0A2S1PME1_EDWTA|nr:Mobilization protein mbeC [Edwardsiella tarda]
MNAVMRCPLTAVHPPSYLIQVIADAGKVTQQRRRQRRKFTYAGRLLVQARLPHPGRELFTVAAFQQTPVLIFRYPHREHLATFICQSCLLITPGRAGNFFPVGLVLDKPQARQWLLAGFGAQP